MSWRWYDLMRLLPVPLTADQRLLPPTEFSKGRTTTHNSFEDSAAGDLIRSITAQLAEAVPYSYRYARHGVKHPSLRYYGLPWI